MRDAHSLVLRLVASLPLLLVASPARAGDAYDDALATAAQLSGGGQLDTAVRVLEEALAWYPQDYALPLQIAWMCYHAGRFADAERYYRVALARSPGAEDARLGLALALEQQGRCEEALPIFKALEEERPDLPAAREARARCTPAPAFVVTPSVALTGTMFPGHPYKSLAGGVTAGLAFAHRSGFFLDATYRYTHFAPAATSGLSAWDQHEGYASLGYSAPLFGLAAQYALVRDGSGTLGTSHHLGIYGRWSPFGDIELRGTASFYDDMKVLRGEASWRLPIAFGLSLRPGVAVEDAGGEVLASGAATLAFDHRYFGLWVGGKYGEEVRPALFAVPVIYDVTERIPYGIWAGVRVNVSEGVRIHGSYALDRLKQPDGTATNAHALSLGVAVSF
jgi:tetratricopeptide (TPR) repeat protein